MRKISWLSFLILLALSVSAFSAQEGILMNQISSKPQTDPYQDSFGIIVSANGKLTVKPGKVFTEGTEEPGTVLPELLSNPKLIVYPGAAVLQRWGGKMLVAIEILTDGSVGSYEIMQSTGHEALDRAAIEALKSWRFHPAVKENGQPIRTCIQIPIIFQLGNE